ncbi:hypothetical protein HKD37_01G000225 [Glycine soja]
MVESTRSKSNWDRLEEVIVKLASNQIHVIEKLDDLMHPVTILENTSPLVASPFSSSAIPTPPTHLTNPPKMKLDVPRFDGLGPSGWPSAHHLDELPAANRIVGLSSPFLLSYFVSGLDLDIRRKVQALQPLTLVHAASLACLQEETLAEHRCGSRGRTFNGPSFSSL